MLQAPVRASLDQLRDVEEIEELSVRKLKEILAANFVDYKGCVEKWELMERVRRLWHSDQANRQKSEYLVPGRIKPQLALCHLCLVSDVCFTLCSPIFFFQPRRLMQQVESFWSLFKIILVHLYISCASHSMG